MAAIYRLKCELLGGLSIFIIICCAWPAVGEIPAPSDSSPIEKRCTAELEKNNWDFHQYRDCVYKLQQQEAVQLDSVACNKDICIYRLEFDGAAAFKGQGFTLRFGSQDSFGISKIALVAPDGKLTTLEQSCGASSCAEPSTVSGAIRGATFKGPYSETGKPYIVLQLPAQGSHDHLANQPNVITRCENQAVIPCSLQKKTIDYRYDIRGDLPSGSQVFKDTRSIVERLRFSNADDVYLFKGNDQDQLTNTGYIYKFGEEINFAINQLRAPKYISWTGIQYMKGSVGFSNGILVRNMSFATVRNGRTWIDNSEVQIRIAPDYRTCSVSFASWTVGDSGTPTKYTFERPIECKVSN